MTTATKTKTTTAPPEPAPQREWQVGDRVRGEHPKTHLPCTGIFHKQGYKYMTLQSPSGTTPILAETAELLTPADEVIERPCPFAEGDALDHQGQRWEVGKVQKTPLLTWRVELFDPEPGVGWSPEYLEWPCDEPCPAVAGAPAVTAEIVATEPTARLAELEADITEGLGLIEQGKAKIWAAVAAVRSEELWRVAGHPSFEAYCEARWNWKKANGHENALAGEVLVELLASGVPVESVPTSTSAMSQLAKAPEGDRAAVLQKAATLNNGNVTEAAVRRALKPEGLPAEHRPSPAAARHAATSPGESALPVEKTPPPVLEASGGGYGVGTRGTLKGCPHSFVVARCTGNSLELWNATERRRVPESEFTPYAQQPPDELPAIARVWLRDLVDALGSEQVRSLLGEVV